MDKSDCKYSCLIFYLQKRIEINLERGNNFCICWQWVFQHTLATKYHLDVVNLVLVGKEVS
jgi:hypothetical protein